MGIKKSLKAVMMCLTIGALMVGCGSSEGTVKEDATVEIQTIKIGITQIVEHPALDAARDGFIEGLNEAGFEGKVEYIAKNAQGDMATAQIIAQEFVDSKVDMIYAIATPTAQAAFNATKEIPIMISAVTDPVAAGLTNSVEEPGTNVSGTSDEAPMGLQLQLLSDLGIDAQTIGFIYNTSEKNSEVQLEMLKIEAEKLGMEVDAMGITSLTEIEQGLDVLLDKVDVLYTPADNMIASGIHLVANKALNKMVPVIGAEGAHVEGGALVTCGVDYFNLGKQTGAMAALVLEGEDVSKLKVQKAMDPEVIINIKTADALGIKPSEEILESSKIVGVE